MPIDISSVSFSTCSYPRRLVGALLYIILTCTLACENPTHPNDLTNYRLYAYPNSGNELYIIDPNTFSLISTLSIPAPDSIGLFGVTFSVDKEYFIFSGMELAPPFAFYIVSYDIKKDSLINMFVTGFDSVGAPRLFPGHNPDEPGLIYLYSHSLGMYSIDFLAQKVLDLISPEHYQGLGKTLKYSLNNKYAGILKKYGGDRSYSEIEIFDTNSGLYEPMTTLNDEDVDSVSVYDFEFSADNQLIYVVYQLSRRRSREIRNYLGVYEINTKTLTTFDIELPWTINPYYMAQSTERKEIYTVGGDDIFYIIDIDNQNIKATVRIEGKTSGASRIAHRDDEEVAFVSCSYDDFIIAIDLDEKEIIRKIVMPRPYLLMIR